MPKEIVSLDELLNRIDHITLTDFPSLNVYESILNEYLRFIKLSEGTLMRCVYGHLLALARHTSDQFVEPYEWSIFHPQVSCKYLTENRHIHILDNVEISWLDERGLIQQQRSPDQAVLLIPLVVDDEVWGAIVVVLPPEYNIPQNDIAAGEEIAIHISKQLQEQKHLPQSQRISANAQKVTRIIEAIRAIPASEQMLDESLKLIRDNFCFYYVGFYRVDHAQNWAFLKAATGKAGQNMIARAHPLSLANETTLVGWGFKNHRPRIALDVGGNAVRFEDPQIPNTRSEIMLPVGKEHLAGILDICSFEPAAFSEEDIPLFQLLSDELEIALQKTYGAMI
jgi:GAF domain-containing protein